MSKKQSKASLYIKPIIILVVAVVSVTLMIISVQSLSHQSNTSSDGGTNESTDSVYDAYYNGYYDETDGYDDADMTVLARLISEDILDLLEYGWSELVFVGRSTCPYCQAFAPKLTKVVAENDYRVWYYDTDVASQADEELYVKVMTTLGIEGVPSFIFISGGEVVDRLADTQSEAAIVEFIERYKDLLGQ